MLSLSYFVTPRDYLIEVHQHETDEATLFDLIADRRVVRNPSHTDHQHEEAAVAAVAELALQHGVDPFNITYDVQGQLDENELFGAK